MAGEPQVTICGNTTAPAELTFTRSGKAVVNFTVMSTPRNKNQDTGQWEDGEPIVARCTAWDQCAENIAETLTEKGVRVLVTGKLAVRSYKAKNGERRQSMELAVEEVGPSLRYATAQVQRVSKNGYGQSQQGTYQAPQGGTQGDPWSQQRSSGYDDTPPF